MIDRLVHHAEVLTLAGDSYRTRQRDELLAKQTRTDRDRRTVQGGQDSPEGSIPGSVDRQTRPPWPHHTKDTV